MNALHVIAGLDPCYGGPSRSVPSLCTALQSTGCRTLLLAVRESGSSEVPGSEAFKQDFERTPVLKALRVSKGLRRALGEQIATSDILHAHGLWLMPNVYAGRIAAVAAKPLVVSSRGMLAPAALEAGALKKRIFWCLVQGPAYSRAAAWHAATLEEASHIRDFGIRAPIAIIPNAVDLPELPATHAAGAMQRTLLFMSRLHPHKGLPSLIDAWARIAPEWPDWNLVIAGPAEGGYEAQIKAKVESLGAPRINFVGAVYGIEKDALMATADLFVLPSKSESFGLAVAEALGAGLPAVVTKGAPWSGLETNGCGWWIDHGHEPLAAALSAAMSLPPEQRRSMGERSRAWMARDFAWSAIAQQMHEVYTWILGGGSSPACVLTD